MKAMNFYTANGWAGSNYDSKLSTKEIAAKVRYYGILDNLDNCIIECYPTKEEAEREAEILNGFTDGNGRLKTVI